MPHSCYKWLEADLSIIVLINFSTNKHPRISLRSSYTINTQGSILVTKDTEVLARQGNKTMFRMVYDTETIMATPKNLLTYLSALLPKANFEIETLI